MPTGVYIRTEEYKQQMSERGKKRAHLMMGELNPAKRLEVREKISIKGKSKHRSSTTEFKKGHISYNKRQGVINSCKLCCSDYYVKNSNKNSKFCSKKCMYNKNGEKSIVLCTICGAKMLLSPSQLKRKFCSKTCCNVWRKTVVLSRETVKKILRRRGKSSLEIKFENIIIKYNLPYKFVGNGVFFIGRKNPDFINTKGEKIAIEVYSISHKNMFKTRGIKQWKKERNESFAKEGWKIIYFDAMELTETNVLHKLGGGTH
jgi:very-short-patch-repair endonuclease